MKNIFLLIIMTTLFGCSKKDNVVTRQGIDVEFTKDYTFTDGVTANRPFNVASMLIWRAEGKQFTYNGLTDKATAYDDVSKTNIAADYTYSNIKSQVIELPAGEYFLAILTDDAETPKMAYTYTSFSLKAGVFIPIKKNLTALPSNAYTPW
ncbi:hypothetical protein [Pedobacter nototheniae]|uniref:hypothetical protein n=1 Tax=Pedobacter nototheniae TaxID=2488994 RepID=UPI0029310DC9|nr:hypothetical protein [Pedobacter nototheniae]